MTTLTWPTLSRDVQSFTWSLLSFTQTQVSPLNQSSLTIELPGARWACSFGYGDFLEADSALLEATLVQLMGRAGRVYLWNFARPVPRGIGTGTPLVNGAGQSGNSLNIDGASNSITGWLKAGDYFGVNGELKMMTADANTNGSGQATLSFSPMLRSSPADNAPITLNKPTATFALADDRQSWAVGPPRLSVHQTLSFVETFG
jgi:hypothetical protein